jgi:hypothetical protein
MANKTQKTKVRDMKPSKDAKGGGGQTLGGNTLGGNTLGGQTSGGNTAGDHKNRRHHGHGRN